MSLCNGKTVFIGCNSAGKWLIKEHENYYYGQSNSTHIQVSVLSPCSVHGISDFLQLIRSRYQPSNHAPMELQTVKTPFQLSLLQEDIVVYFLAGKPLIHIESSSPLRIPFKFHQPINSVKEAEWVVCMYMCEGAYIMVAEGYTGFHARFLKFTGEVFDCDCNVQLSTAIHYFGFQHAIIVTTISTFNHDSVFQCSTATETFNRNSTFQHSTVIPTFTRDFNYQPWF